VQTAVAVSASEQGNANGDFCKVVGIVKPQNPSSPNLEFEVNLPQSWNRRALQMGGGGYNGTLVTGLTGFTLQPANVDNPLKQGFVTLGTDGGHKSTQGFDGSFALDDEALRNFGKESIKKGHDAAMAIVKKAYGGAPSGSISSAARRAATRHSMPPRAIRTTTTASSRIIPRTTSRCCIWDRSTSAARCMRAAARRGSIRPR
jgi:hypothetical protein